jgi:molecular chaperone GrpE
MPDQEMTPDGVDKPLEKGQLGEALEAISLERDRLLAEKTDLQNTLLRLAAEFDNFRKRTERERNDFFEYASADAVKALLPVLDDFERALKTPCSDAEYVKGIELIYQRTCETLKKLGLEPIEAEGQSFDPNVHHAIEMVHDEEHEDQAVVAQLLRGYSFKGRLLRAAMVKVAVHN